VLQVRHDRFIRLVSEFANDATVSVYFNKYFQNKAVPCLGQHKSDIINYIERKRIEQLSKIRGTEYNCFMAVTIPIVENRESKGGLDFLGKMQAKTADPDAIKRDLWEKISKATERLNTYLKGFTSAIGGGVFRLDSQQIVHFFSLLLNHNLSNEFSELAGVMKSDIFCSFNNILDSSRGGYVYYGGNYHAVFSLRAYGRESSLPEFTTPAMNQIFFHSDLQDIPFTVHHAVNMLSRDKGLGTAKGRRSRMVIQSGFAKNLSFLAKTPEGVPPEVLKQYIDEAISTVENNGYRFVTQQFQIHLWAPTLKELEDTCDTFNAVIARIYKMKREKFNIKVAYFSLFPGNEDTNPINTMLSTFSVSDFLPIDMPRFCYPAAKSKNFIYYYTKENQLTTIDLFDKRADNWNAIICGGSGSGKSFLCNDILFQYAVYNPQIAIVDYGGAEAGSYRNFVINNKGTYLEINLDAKNFSINPFDGVLFDEDGSPIPWKIVSLSSTITRMATVESHISEQTKYHLTEEIKKYYKDTNNNAEGTCNLGDFAQKYLKDNPLFLGNEDVYKRIHVFIGYGESEGPYARFFRKTQEITSTDIVCFDLAGLKGHQALKSVLVPALLDMIVNNVLGSKEKERKKLLVMDEAWADLKGGAMADFMEEMFRTVRKLNGSITIITQRFSDVLGSDIGGALVANTSYFWFVGNKHDPEPLKNAAASSSTGTLKLTPFDIETIITSKSKQDFFMLTPFFSGLLKLYPSKEFAMVATTDPDDKNILRRHMKLLGADIVTPEVIENAKKDF